MFLTKFKISTCHLSPVQVVLVIDSMKQNCWHVLILLLLSGELGKLVLVNAGNRLLPSQKVKQSLNNLSVLLPTFMVKDTLSLVVCAFSFLTQEVVHAQVKFA